MKKYFIGLFILGLLFSTAKLTIAAPTCELTNLPKSGGPGDYTIKYKIMGGGSKSEKFGVLSWGAGYDTFGPSMGSLVGEVTHYFGPGSHAIDLECSNDDGTSYASSFIDVEGGGGESAKQCKDNIDNDWDRLTDYGSDPDCDSESDNDEYGGEQPTWVTVIVDSNYSAGGYSVDCPTDSPYNRDGQAPDCPFGGTGYYQEFNPLAGGGNYTITPYVPGGCVVDINGERRTSFTHTQYYNPGNNNIRFDLDFWDAIDNSRPCGSPPPCPNAANPACNNPGTPSTVALTPEFTTVGPGWQPAVTYTWNNLASSSPTDWIALLGVAADGQTKPWNGNYASKYWNGSSRSTGTVPTAMPNTTNNFRLLVPANESVVRFVYFKGGTNSELGRSVDITVNNPNGIAFSCVPPYSGTTWGKVCTVRSEDAVNLQWTAANATGCTTSWNGAQPASGLQSSGPVTSDTVFTVNCAWANGTTASDTVNVRVAGMNLQCKTPTGPYSEGPCTVPAGGTATLQWNSSNISDNCTASGGWSGSKAPSSTQNITVNASNNYALSCATTNGPTLTDSAVLTNSSVVNFHLGCSANACVVLPGAGPDQCATNSDCSGSGTGNCTISASLDRIVIPPLKSSTLTWSCQNVQNCTLTSVGGVAVSGSTPVTPSATTDYSVVCDNVDGSGTSTATVRIRVFRFEGGVLREVLPGTPTTP